MLFYDGYGEHLLRTLIHGLFVQKVVSPKVLNKPTDKSVIDNLIETVQPKLFDSDSRWSAEPNAPDGVRPAPAFLTACGRLP